jgi:hypothetical protein
MILTKVADEQARRRGYPGAREPESGIMLPAEPVRREGGGRQKIRNGKDSAWTGMVMVSQLTRMKVPACKGGLTGPAPAFSAAPHTGCQP